MITPDRILRSRRKTISIEIGSDGSFVVRAPLHAPEEDIMRFVSEKQSWILQKLSVTERAGARAGKITGAQGSCIPFLGQMLPIDSHDRREIRLDNAATLMEDARPADGGFPVSASAVLYLPSPQMRTTEIQLVPPVYSEEELSAQNRTLLVMWYKEQAALLLRRRMDEYAARMALSYERIRITSARTNWGSCNADRGINFTWLLITLSLYEIEYVVVHELAHIRHRDHSPAFYAEVERILPDYRSRMQLMKKNQWVLEIWK